MTNNRKLTLEDDDPRVVDARNAEQRLYAAYGLVAKDHYFQLPGLGIRLRVSEFGSGPPILIVPGNTGDAFPLAPLMHTLRGRRIIAVNRPGGGLSEGMDHREVDIRQFAVATLTTVLDAMNLDQVDVVAHSMGAHWSFWLAMDRPDRVRRLVTLGNPGNVMKGGAPFVLRLATKFPFSWFLGKLITGGSRKNVLGGLKMMGHDKAALEKLPEAFGDSYFHFRQLPHYLISLMSLMQNAPSPLRENDLAQVPQPVALLWGENDTFASPDVGQSIANALPLGELHRLVGTGHLPWLEDPEKCGEIILKFLSS